MNAINWFEIPARDIQRAQRFYETLLGVTMRREVSDGQNLAIFPAGETEATGCLMDGMTPGQGTRVYLAVEPSLDHALERLARAGGRLVTPKVKLPDGQGVYAHIEDSEGNQVGLHALR